ncbi:MAG: NTP transferase domain-containing protein [Saccharofermentans sp.]|nr:NTP transferase domain-containing protein [Saccharofermentans sp.]
MSIYESDLLMLLNRSTFVTQKELSERSSLSIGMVNKCLHDLVDKGYLNNDFSLTDKAGSLLADSMVDSAIILAAGTGMRMVPVNHVQSKGLLEVKGERLVERQIRFLLEAGIKKIKIVVGFMKESYEYLIDKFGVELIVCDDYIFKNNIYSVYLATTHSESSYIIPCDIWFNDNPFRSYELYSWYMVSESSDSESTVSSNRKQELVRTSNGGNRMIGISYLRKEDMKELRSKIEDLLKNPNHYRSFWEEGLFHSNKMFVLSRVVKDGDYIEINTYEQLREIDSNSIGLKSEAINVLCEVFGCASDDIKNITTLKKGMTNRSFSFCINGIKYIMRIPGEGTDMLINRKQEADVFKTISGHGFCDDPVYIDPDNGYKITKFLENARTCDITSEDDLRICMKKLKEFHDEKLKVDHEFNIFGQIEFYEGLWDSHCSAYSDYQDTKNNVFALRPFIDTVKGEYSLTHIDAVPDNFLFYTTDKGNEEVQLTDWEYSGMQDPHVDIAMFCIYSLFDKDSCDKLIDMYFDGRCDMLTIKKIYCYIAACGLLWSNWCEYKRQFGIEFGEYSLRQYRYAKEFYRYAISLSSEGEIKCIR